MIVDKPKDNKTVGCRWVFTVKHKPDGTVDRYKARLMAKGYIQTYEVDYEETCMCYPLPDSPPWLGPTTT